jgi:kynurenine formamidase
MQMGLADRTPPSTEEYAEYPSRFSNWGRWGDDDELGTLNFVTPELRRAAAQLVREGRSVSCSRPIDTTPGPANPYPARHMVAVTGSGQMCDYLSLFIHGMTETHLDALCHLSVLEGGATWNGKPLDGYSMPLEHTGTVDYWRDGIVTRGVLYDIPRLRGTASIEPGAPVHGWELADAAAAQGIEPRAGDAVLIRGGFGRYFETHDERPGFGSAAGVHASCVEFLYEHSASMLVWDFQDAPGADQGLANPKGIPVALHVHQIVLPYMGMPILDNADFEALAGACAEAGRWEFQFVVAPLVITRGTGSPVNPIAVL